MRTCDVEGCENKHVARGMCGKHYQQCKGKFNASQAKQPILKNLPCSIDGCEVNTYARGWCHTHYQRWRHHGNPETYLIEPSPPCKVDGCDKQSRARKFCKKHLHRFYKYGDPNVILRERLPYVTYNNVHLRLRAQRGPAKDQMCVDCGGQADEWSYNHQDPDEMWETHDHMGIVVTVPYSTNLDYYEPRCKSDHIAFDKAVA